MTTKGIERQGSQAGGRLAGAAMSVSDARDKLRACQLRLDAAWPANPLDKEAWAELRKAMSAYKEAADAFQTALFENLRRDAREKAQAQRDEEKAAEEKHEREMRHLLTLDEDYRRGTEIVAQYNKAKEKIENNGRLEVAAKERELEVEYERMLTSWKGHVEKLMLDRVELIAQEQASQHKKVAVWASQDAAEIGRDDALAVYLSGLIAQAASSGDAISISAPSSAPSADGAGTSGSALVAALMAVAGSADDSALSSKLRCAMSEKDFFGMLDGLFASKPAAPAKAPKA